MVVIILLIRFPKVERKADEIVGPWKTHVELFRKRVVILFFLGIFAYVGTEQGIANWISEFLRTYHGMRPEIEGARTVGLFWGLMTVGCVLGLALLKIMDSKLVLRIFTVSRTDSAVIHPFRKFTPGPYRLSGTWLLPFGSMYAIIFSLALNSISKYHGSFAGILCLP